MATSAIALGACAHRGAPRSPAEAAAAFAAALAKGDAAAAYGAMSDEFRRRVGFDRFRQELAALDAEDLARLGRWAVAADGAVVVRPTAEPLALSLSARSGAWALTELPIRPFGQDTPEQALRTFVRAASSHRYDVLMRLVPERERGHVTPERLRDFWEGAGASEAASLLAELRLHAGDAIVADDDRASLTYESAGRARVVRFVREDGAWRIDRID